MSNSDLFSDEGLHEQIVAEVKAADDGGKPGNLTKKKEKIIEKEYEKQGGGYKDANDDGEDEEKKRDQEEDVDMDDAEPDETNSHDSEDEDKKTTGQKRKDPPTTGDSKSPCPKKTKTHGSKHDSTSEPAPQGSATRLPKVGQRVSWKAMPGWVHGEVMKIIKENKDVEGKKVKASEDDPRIVMRSESGKICVHKPGNYWFDD